MAEFAYYVCRTSGVIKSLRDNWGYILPEGGFYSFEKAMQFAKSIQEPLNFCVIYDKNGNIHTVLPRV